MKTEVTKHYIAYRVRKPVRTQTQAEVAAVEVIVTAPKRAEAVLVAERTIATIKKTLGLRLAGIN
jgi:hypothetical protein